MIIKRILLIAIFSINMYHCCKDTSIIVPTPDVIYFKQFLFDGHNMTFVDNNYTKHNLIHNSFNTLIQTRTFKNEYYSITISCFTNYDDGYYRTIINVNDYEILNSCIHNISLSKVYRYMWKNGFVVNVYIYYANNNYIVHSYVFYNGSDEYATYDIYKYANHKLYYAMCIVFMSVFICVMVCAISYINYKKNILFISNRKTPMANRENEL